MHLTREMIMRMYVISSVFCLFIFFLYKLTIIKAGAPSGVYYAHAGDQLPGTSNSLPNDNRLLKDKLFYIYDLPEEFWWRWPKPSADCSKNGYVGHDHALYSGMGPPINETDGLYLTWHFSLFSSMFNRMKRSRRRTLDPEKADLFVIPYDLGLDGYVDPDRCTMRRGCTRGLPQKLQKILSDSKYWQKHHGADHVLLWSLGNYHPWPRNGCDIFMKDFCKRCTITCYWMDPSIREHRFISVPFPSAYHWHDNIKNLPWEVSETRTQERVTMATYLGSTQTLNPFHTKIRRAMAKQCEESQNCKWLQIAHSSKDSSIGDYLSVYKKSVFCLCPPGDDPARKAVFDAIISGCIPVIFHESTLYNQYPWHFNEGEALEISISVPGDKVRRNQIKFMEFLEKVSPEVIKMKQQKIAQVAKRLQYALPPLTLLNDTKDATPWEPPFPDGVDRILDGCFNRSMYAIRNQTTGIPRRTMNLREWSAEYSTLQAVVPGSLSESDLVYGKYVNVTPGTLVPSAFGLGQGHVHKSKPKGAKGKAKQVAHPKVKISHTNKDYKGMKGKAAYRANATSTYHQKVIQRMIHGDGEQISISNRVKSLNRRKRVEEGDGEGEVREDEVIEGNKQDTNLPSPSSLDMLSTSLAKIGSEPLKSLELVSPEDTITDMKPK